MTTMKHSIALSIFLFAATMLSVAQSDGITDDSEIADRQTAKIVQILGLDSEQEKKVREVALEVIREFQSGRGFQSDYGGKNQPEDDMVQYVTELNRRIDSFLTDEQRYELNMRSERYLTKLAERKSSKN